MSELERIRRRFFLAVLRMIRRDIEKEINRKEFDRILSGNLDSALNLQKRYGARPFDPRGSALTTSGAPTLLGREIEIEHLQG